MLISTKIPLLSTFNRVARFQSTFCMLGGNIISTLKYCAGINVKLQTNVCNHGRFFFIVILENQIKSYRYSLYKTLKASPCTE